MKTVLRKISLCLVLLMATLCFVACGKTEISFNEYVSLKSTGYDGEGSIEVEINYSKLMSDNEENIDADDTAKTARLFRKIVFTPDKTENLKNGDVVHVEWTEIDLESFEEVGIVPVYSALDLTVEGLKVLDATDIFKDIEVQLEGYDGYATARMSNWPSSEYRYMFDYSLDGEKRYKNGDVVVVTAIIKSAYEDALDRMASDGVKPASMTYEYKVSGLAPVEEYNPFDYVDVQYYGTSGRGNIVVFFKEDAPEALRSSVYFEYENNTDVKNGDVVKVKTNNWYSSEADLAQYKGIKLSVNETEIEVNNLEDCLRTVDSVSEDIRHEMNANNFRDYHGNASSFMSEPAALNQSWYIGSIITASENWYGGQNSNLFMVYKSFIDSRYDADRYVYWYAKYEDVIVHSDGTLNIDGESDFRLPDGRYSEYSGLDGEIFAGETGKTYYVGYATFDELLQGITSSGDVVLENKIEGSLTVDDLPVADYSKSGSFAAVMDYVSEDEYIHDQYGTDSHVIIDGNGTYTVSITENSLADYINVRDLKFPRLGVVIAHLGEVYDLSKIKVSDVSVTIDGEEQKVKDKKVAKGNFINYPGNATDYAFYLVYKNSYVEENVDNQYDFASVETNNAYNISITFTISGLTEKNRLVPSEEETVVTGTDNEGTGDVVVDDNGNSDEVTDETGDTVVTDDGNSNRITYSVSLKVGGESKIQAIKVVRDLTGLGLKEAKELVDNAPSVVLEHVSYDDAKAAVEAFEGVGAIADFTEEQ